jgi:hypothetical protein
MSYSERRKQSDAYWKDQNHRMGLDSKDNWEGNEDGFITYLLGISGCKWVEVDGVRSLVTIRGFEYVDDYFADYDDVESFSYNRAVGRKYLDWMLMVRKRYNKLKKSGKIKDVNVKKAERKEHKYWVNYYNNHPQFSRPEGY